MSPLLPWLQVSVFAEAGDEFIQRGSGEWGENGHLGKRVQGEAGAKPCVLASEGKGPWVFGERGLETGSFPIFRGHQNAGAVLCGWTGKSKLRKW